MGIGMIRSSWGVLIVLAALVGGACTAAATPTPGATPTSQTTAEATPTEGPNLQALRAKGKMVCGTSADFPPYESKDAAGEFVGFDMDLIREIGTKLGIQVEIQDMSFDAIIASVQEKKIDCGIAALQITGERAEQVLFSIEYDMPVQGILAKKGSGITLTEPEQMAPYKVGCQTGGSNCNWIQDNLISTGLMQASQLSTYERMDQGVLDLKAGRIDLLTTGGDNALSLAEANDDLEVALLTQKMVASGHVIAYPKDWADVKAAIDVILQQFIDDGTIRSLQEKNGVALPPATP